VFAVALAISLLWRNRHHIGRANAPEPKAAAFITVLSFVWLAGVILSAQVVHLSLAPVILLLWATAVLGRESLRPLAPAAAAFSLALPIWEVLVWPLQMATVWVNRLLLMFTPFSAEIDGTAIHLPAGTLVVADSCSGLNFFLVSLLLGLTYAMFFTEGLAARRRVLGMAVGLALVANWIRVFGLVVIADVSEMRSSIIEDHATYGWIIFAIAMGAFIWGAERISVRGQWAPATAAEAARLPKHITFSPRSARVALVATMAATVGPALWALSARRESSDRATPAPTGLNGIAAWESSPLTENRKEWEPGFAGATEHTATRWTMGSDTVQVDRFIYRTQRQGRELIGDGNALVGKRDLLTDRLVGPLDMSMRVVREAIVRDTVGSSMTSIPVDSTGSRRSASLRLVWYWYRVAGVDTPSPTKAKLLELVSFFRTSAPSEVMVLSSSCPANDCAPAQRRLRRLASATTPSGSASR
jgi:EpsI family protein